MKLCMQLQNKFYYCQIIIVLRLSLTNSHTFLDTVMPPWGGGGRGGGGDPPGLELFFKYNVSI